MSALPGESVYAYLVLSSALFGIWVLLYALRADIRQELLSR